jgi:hypothetical protein
VKTPEEIRNALVAVSGLLDWHFLSPPTRNQLQVFKAELEAELDFILSQQEDMAAD